MQMHAPNARRRVALIAGCCMLLGGCAAFQRNLSPKESFRLVPEMGPAEPAAAAIPPDAEAMGHFLKAEVALNEGDHDVATKEYELAVAADPISALLRQRLATLYVRANRLQDALAQVRRCVELEPSDAQSRVLLAGIFSALNQDADAMAEYEKVLQLDPNNQEARLFLGALYGKQGDYDRAVTTLDELTHISPHSFLGFYYLGRVEAA
ncbi:MAG TPA: tetratricopeptide repeat protein, partial [Candidatus Acidoferrales bacterium]|nr:tetratricopeptide repeat protein [Candidatus Acidoferrales bacterium]